MKSDKTGGKIGGNISHKIEIIKFKWMFTIPLYIDISVFKGI